VAKIHRPVRCAQDCPVCRLRPRQRSATRSVGQHVDSANGHQVTPNCSVCHGAGGCNGRLRQIRKGITYYLLYGGATDCPVRPRTEGNKSLPNGTPTTLSCLGAIKGTPRRMEQDTKQSLNIQQRGDIEFAPFASLL
jgi:hypothetical protein